MKRCVAACGAKGLTCRVSATLVLFSEDITSAKETKRRVELQRAARRLPACLLPHMHLQLASGCMEGRPYSLLAFKLLLLLLFLLLFVLLLVRQ